MENPPSKFEVDREEAWSLLFEALEDDFANLGFEDGEIPPRKVTCDEDCESTPTLWCDYEKFTLEFFKRLEANIDRLSKPLLDMVAGLTPLDAELFEKNSRAIRLYRWIAKIGNHVSSQPSIRSFFKRLDHLRGKIEAAHHEHTRRIEDLRRQIAALEESNATIDRLHQSVTAIDSLLSPFAMPEHSLETIKVLIRARLWEADYHDMSELAKDAPNEIRDQILSDWQTIVDIRSQARKILRFRPGDPLEIEAED